VKFGTTKKVATVATKKDIEPIKSSSTRSLSEIVADVRERLHKGYQPTFLPCRQEEKETVSLDDYIRLFTCKDRTILATMCDQSHARSDLCMWKSWNR
jgi:hypothetical protein